MWVNKRSGHFHWFSEESSFRTGCELFLQMQWKTVQRSTPVLEALHAATGEMHPLLTDCGLHFMEFDINQNSNCKFGNDY